MELLELLNQFSFDIRHKNNYNQLLYQGTSNRYCICNYTETYIVSVYVTVTVSVTDTVTDTTILIRREFMDYRLTKRQEDFCRLVAVDGKSYVDAYREAYGSQAVNNTIAPKGSRLAKKDKIQTRISEIQKETTSRLTMGQTERHETLSEVARNKGERTRDRLTALDMLAKAQGDYVTVTESRSLNLNLDLSQYSTTDLDLLRGRILEEERLLQKSQSIESLGER